MAANDTSTTSPVSGQELAGQIQAEQTQGEITTINQVAGVAAAMFNERAATVLHQADIAGVGRGFQLSPEQVQATLTKADQTIADLNAMLSSAGRAEAAVHTPGPDPASVQMTTTVQRTLKNLVANTQSLIDYWTAWRSKLAQAKQNYLNTEHLTEQQWHQQAQGMNA